MKSFPYATDYINDAFTKEEQRFDYIFLRPPLLVFYFFLRCIVFPIKYLIHRRLNPHPASGYAAQKQIPIS